MNLTYFNEHLHEELNDAKAYMDKAIESKIHHPEWVHMFVNMADGEIKHATILMTMMEQCIKANKSVPSSIISPSGMETSITTTPESTYKDCMKTYGETMTYVTNLKRGL